MRISAANNYIQGFGIATECAWGRARYKMRQQTALAYTLKRLLRITPVITQTQVIQVSPWFFFSLPRLWQTLIHCIPEDKLILTSSARGADDWYPSDQGLCLHGLPVFPQG